MESSGVAGQINITGVTYELVKDFFICEYRGKMPIKYKGEIDMYFVRSIIPELSINGLGKEVNDLFRIRLQHIRFNDLEEVIMERLKNELSPLMYYHNHEHVADVVLQIEILGRNEKVSEEDLLILKTAALMHDIGFLISYSEHVKNSIELTKDILQSYQYTSYQIDQIVQLIEKTSLKAKPANLLEYIIKDADLDYLGRPDFMTQSENLYKEMIEFGKEITHSEWQSKQNEFFLKHRFYSESARKMRQVNKDKHFQKIKKNIINI
jgi:HD superfamily phosphodiesterase